MTWADFRRIIEKSNLPSRYGLFNTAQTPPYLIYGTDDKSALMADNIHYLPITNGYLELYTEFPEFEIQKQIQDLLTANQIPWSFENEAHLDTENVWLTRWAISFIGG